MVEAGSVLVDVSVAGAEVVWLVRNVDVRVDVAPKPPSSKLTTALVCTRASNARISGPRGPLPFCDQLIRATVAAAAAAAAAVALLAGGCKRTTTSAGRSSAEETRGRPSNGMEQSRV